MLKSDLNDYNDAYILVKERISVKGTDNANRWNKKLTFKNNALFRSCISKTNNTLIANAEDFDIVMPMQNLLEYNDNYYSVTPGHSRNYYRHQVIDAANENDGANNNINNNKTTSKSFEYKTKSIGSTPNKNSR